MNALSRPAPLVLSAILMATMTLTSTPAAAQRAVFAVALHAPVDQYRFLRRVEGGLKLVLNSDNFNFDTGYAWARGGLRLHGTALRTGRSVSAATTAALSRSFGTNGTFDQLTFMVNGLYDFFPARR